MRQGGYLAAACIYALDHHVDRLAEDHGRAQKIGEVAAELSYVEMVYPVDTNIVIVQLKPGKSESWLLQELQGRGVQAVPFGPGLVRFVTHLDFTENDLDQTCEVLNQIAS